MAISNFNKIKPIDVPSVTGTPTISKAQCLKIEGGDDSTTGTGNIVLDWTNISSKADIAVYDENDNLLDYYFESFDATAETAVIWVYRDWVRDGSTQAQIAYGNGPSDQSVVASTVFDKDSILEDGYLLNESSGDAQDVTSNNNNLTNNGATQGATGIVDGAYDFNGSSDYLQSQSNTDLLNTNNECSIILWINKNSNTSGHFVIWGDSNNFATGLYLQDQTDEIRAFFGNGTNSVNSGNLTANTGEWYFVYIEATSSRVFLETNATNSIEASHSLDLSALGNYEYELGRIEDYSNYVDAKEDNVMFFNSTLTQDERSALYAATKSSPDFFSQQAGEKTAVKLNTFFPVPF